MYAALLAAGIQTSAAEEGTPAIEISSPVESAEVAGPGFVSLAAGENRIRIQVRDREGRSGSRDRLVIYRPSEPKDAEEVRRFDEQGKALLERLRTRTVEAELVHQIEQARSKEPTRGHELELRTGPKQDAPTGAQ